MTAVPVDNSCNPKPPLYGAWKASLLVCAGLVVIGFWVFALFVLLPLVAG
jgi:hypothetical protein